jgi:hypothetical protein
MPQPSFPDNHLEFPGKQAGYRPGGSCRVGRPAAFSERDGAAGPPRPGGLRRAASGYRGRSRVHPRRPARNPPGTGDATARSATKDAESLRRELCMVPPLHMGV